MNELYVLLFVAVLLAIVVAGVLLFVIQRLKRRRAQLLADLNTPSRLLPDRAFNRLEMARREIAILARQGTDVARARELVAQSQSAFDLRQFSRSYELAQSAHEALVHARQGVPLPSAAGTTPVAGNGGASGPDPPGESGEAAARDPSRTAPSVALSGEPPAPAPRIPHNRMESQFQLRLLDSDLERARADRPSAAATTTATGLRAQAQGAFDREEYTDALRLALKGRRELGGDLGTVAVSPSAPTTRGGGNGAALDPASAAEEAASASRCPQCGYPSQADDAFCRGCGLPRQSLVCPGCGASRGPSDTFCGRCGQRFS